MAETAKQEVIAEWESAAAELETAARHLRTAAQHMREGEVPRACAHAFAALGHVEKGDEAIRKTARVHAAHAVP